MDSEASLKFLVWVADHFGFLAMLVVFLLGLLSVLIWKVWKGFEERMSDQTAMGRALTIEVAAMHNSVLLAVLAMPTVITEFKRQAELNMEHLNERQRCKNP